MTVYEYIKQEENNWRVVRVPITKSKDWNMSEHIERCTNVANGWFHSGNNDGTRPYDDIVTPIINVAFRTEGFDVKDVVPFIENPDEDYKSLLIKKYHPLFARKNLLDELFDEIVESSIIYDLVLIKEVSGVKPEVVDLKTIAFCDQTNVLAGPICIKHQYTPQELTEMDSKWDKDKIRQAIIMSKEEKTVPTTNGDQTVKTPSKYIEVYELRGNLPENWIKSDGDSFNYVPQLHIVCFYKSVDGERNGITLYSGRDRKLTETFKALKIDKVRSKGRACGRSIVESLFEHQVWINYDAIKIKKLLDSAFNLIISDSTELANQKLDELKSNTILKQEKGANTQRITSDLGNITAFSNHQATLESKARIIGSASDAQLGTNPASGTPFALQSLVVQQGQGIHEYRQGKIASFVADIIYPEIIMKKLVEDMNNGKTFSEVLSLDEIKYITDKIVTNELNSRKKEMLIGGKIMTPEEESIFETTIRESFKNGGERKFFEILKDELKEIPIKVFINIKQKQKDMSVYADKVTNILREILRDPTKFSQVPGVGKVFNQLLENAGLNAVDFSTIVNAPQPELPAPVGEAELIA